jgi:hypothetical protein
MWVSCLVEEESKSLNVMIDFPPELEQTLRQQAARSGQEVSAFILQAVREKIAK